MCKENYNAVAAMSDRPRLLQASPIEVVPNTRTRLFSAEYRINTNDEKVREQYQFNDFTQKPVVAENLSRAALKAEEAAPEGFRLVAVNEQRTTIVL